MTPQERAAQLMSDPDALPLLWNVDPDGHHYPHDLLDLAQENHT